MNHSHECKIRQYEFHQETFRLNKLFYFISDLSGTVWIKCSDLANKLDIKIDEYEVYDNIFRN
jgi:hypothetical protein